jgi:hypothetical protein
MTALQMANSRLLLELYQLNFITLSLFCRALSIPYVSDLARDGWDSIPTADGDGVDPDETTVQATATKCQTVCQMGYARA